MKPTASHVIVGALSLCLGAGAIAGIQKAAAPTQAVTLHMARFASDGSVRLALGVKQGALSGGIEVTCPAKGAATAAGKPAPSAEALCKAARALPPAVTASANDLAALLGK